MANQIIDVILEFLRISFTTWPNVFIISTGPLIIVVGGLISSGSPTSRSTLGSWPLCSGGGASLSAGPDPRRRASYC